MKLIIREGENETSVQNVKGRDHLVEEDIDGEIMFKIDPKETGWDERLSYVRGMEFRDQLSD
jgi:hypothetical protein